MRVGLDYRPALLLRSGIGRYAANLVRELPEVDEELSLSLFAVFWNEHEKKLAQASLPEHERIAIAARRFPGRVLDLLGRYTPLSVETFADALDVFHFTDYVRPPVRVKARVFTLHDASFMHDQAWHSDENKERLETVTRELIAESQVVVTVSESSRDEAMRYFDLSDDRIVVAPLGVDEIFHQPYQRREQKVPHILSLGTLEPRKNLVRLLKAFEQLLESGVEVRLTLVGREGWLCEDVKEMLARPRIAEHCVWLGEIEDHNLLALMRNATLLAYPSLFEGFGLPVLEGMALGLPVLTSDRGALAEVAGDAAEIVDPESVEDIAAGLRRLLGDPHRRAELVAKGKERAREFTWRRCAEQTVVAYRRALALAENAS